MADVIKVFTGSISPGATFFWWGFVKYPNNSPDLFVSWLPRPVYPPGHLGHPSHQLTITGNQSCERDPSDTTGDGGLIYRGAFQSTGTHNTDFEMLALYQKI